MASPLQFSPNKFAMFIDAQTLTAVETGVTPGHDSGERRAEGFDNTLYAKREVPLKRIPITSEGEENYHIALYRYSLDCRNEILHGASVALLIVTAQSSQQLLDGVVNGLIDARPKQHGMHLAKPLTSYGFFKYVTHPLLAEIGEDLLSIGLNFLEQQTLGNPQKIVDNPILASKFQ